MNFLFRLATWQNILFLLLVNMVFAFYIFPKSQAAIIRETKLDLKILDVRWSYSIEDVEDLFRDLQPKGREIYRHSESTNDMVFPLTYGLFFMLLMAFLLRKIGRENHSWRYLALLPVVGVLGDYLENFSVINLLDHYETLSPEVIQYALVGTQIKWVGIGLSVLSLVSLLLLGSIPFFRKK